MRRIEIWAALLGAVIGVSLWMVEASPAQQHGPDAECTRICAPEGMNVEGEKLPTYTCQGSRDDSYSCAKQGTACSGKHRSGCAENCRSQCCRCCDII